MISKIYYSTRFEKELKRLSKRYKREFVKQEKIFRKDPFNSILKTHKLKGKLKSCWSFSITHSHRIMFEFIKENEVIFYKIGTHRIYQ